MSDRAEAERSDLWLAELDENDDRQRVLRLLGRCYALLTQRSALDDWDDDGSGERMQLRAAVGHFLWPADGHRPQDRWMKMAGQQREYDSLVALVSGLADDEPDAWRRHMLETTATIMRLWLIEGTQELKQEVRRLRAALAGKERQT